ncbi:MULTISPECIES: hypothetical protein [unclassified Chelatococcus]|uniref:hypothetical protein n=1 Tax=unclassified Chelatococcus TaxID=2638111 RepID=UPI001BCC4FC1|nr:MULTISPECIES: hypothetical protein [unclassified Chelatococcus]MBS7700295.1 hypothetical protein [Chelatococcus sp. YT9]MBX3558266.1 hypothetical protein [Chelatococcus sp.]
MRKRNEIAIAQAILTALGSEATAQDADFFDPAACGPDDLSAWARSALCGVPELPPALPTAAPAPKVEI